jgi:shikimate kinase
MKYPKNITLIGMPGAGKSLLGKQLAKDLGYEFVDVDEIIEKETGLKLQEIIDKFGDEELMLREERAVLGLGSLNHYVIAPGGSVVYSKDAMRFLKSVSKVILLNAPYKDIEKRLPNLNARGIVGLQKKGLRELYKERMPLYKSYADVVVDVPEDLTMVTLSRII